MTSNTSSNAHIKSTLAPTFFARSRRSSSRHRDSFNREKPVLVAPRTAQQQQPKVSSLFRRNTSVSSGSGSSAAALPQSSASAVADSDSYEDDESDFTDETDNDDDMEADEGARGVARELSGSGSVSGGNLRRSDTSTSIVRGFSPSKTSVSFLGRSSEMKQHGAAGSGAGIVSAGVNGSSVNGTSITASSQYQQVPRQKQKMFFIESSPSESDGFGESVTKSDCSFSPLKMEPRLSGQSGHAASKSSLVDRSVEKSVDKSVKKHVSVQSPLSSTPPSTTTTTTTTTTTLTGTLWRVMVLLQMRSPHFHGRKTFQATISSVRRFCRLCSSTTPIVCRSRYSRARTSHASFPRA